MKKNISYAIMTVVTVGVLASCQSETSKSNEEKVSTKEINSQKETTNNSFDVIFDKWWIADNGAYQYFGKDGIYKNHPETDMKGSWKWSEEGNKMTISLMGQDNELEIKELSANKLVVSMMGMDMTFNQMK